ncbi:MAG: hypothetical protein AAB909_00745, partial [Patescibacteria group bacterium]
ILNAIDQYAADNRGNLTALGIPDTTAGAAVVGDGVGEVDVCALLVPTYLAALPVDPLTNNGASVADCTAAHTTNYSVVRSTTNNRVTVAAPGAELNEVISVTR